ncbi:MAG: hypothetical protein EBR67_11095, partial [Proteobacteria bacterium]|nr:hypothetical protein [Pseudomonadota bacterium]
MDDKTKNKVLIAIGLIFLILIGTIVFLASKLDDLKSEIKNLQNKNFEKLPDEVAKPSPTQGTIKTVEDEIKDRGLPVKDIKSDADKNGAAISGVTTIVVKTEGQTGNNASSTRTEPSSVIIREIPKDCKCPYIASTEYKIFYERFGQEYVPFGEIGFTAAASPNPWSYQIFPRDYSVTTVIAEDENHKKTTYSSFQLRVEGQTF